MLMTVLVADVMCKRVEFIDSDANILEAIESIVLKKISALVVRENNKAVGVVTLRDIVLRCLANGLDPKVMKVSEIASSPVITVECNTTIDEVVKLLKEHRITRVFVQEKS